VNPFSHCAKKVLQYNRGMSQFVRVFLILILIVGLSTFSAVQAQGSGQSGSISQKQMMDLILEQQRRNDQLKAELARAHREIDDLQRQVKELTNAFTQFKNYYFRHI
jgi:TolA-binding protein